MTKSLAASPRKILVEPKNISPSRNDFEVIGVFNPGAVLTADGVVLLTRIVERPRDSRTGFVGLPRWEDGGMTVDWVATDELEFVDSRVVRCKADGLVRLTFTSYLKAVRLSDATNVGDLDGAVFVPEGLLEEFGLEDPRITPLNGRYYLTYVAVSRCGVVTALASTEDFCTFTRHGVIFGPDNKDVVLFPERIAGQYVAIHRPSGGTGFSRPEMWLARSPDLVHWGQHQHLLRVGTTWDNGRIGAGPPPVRIAEGWLVIYHGNQRPEQPGEVGVYSAGALLLAHDDPSRILRRSTRPIFTPQTEFEREGFVSNVVFPTGIVVEDRTLHVYYGAGDTSSAVVQWSLDEVLASLTT